MHGDIECIGAILVIDHNLGGNCQILTDCGGCVIFKTETGNSSTIGDLNCLPCNGNWLHKFSIDQLSLWQRDDGQIIFQCFCIEITMDEGTGGRQTNNFTGFNVSVADAELFGTIELEVDKSMSVSTSERE